MELKLQAVMEPLEVVRLSPIDREDLAQAIVWAEDPSFAEFFRRFPPLQDWMSWDKASMVLQCCYKVSTDNCLVGLATIYRHDQENVELGLLLVESARHLSSVVRDKMLDYSFHYLKVNRAFVRILESRTGMIAKHIGAGFVLEGKTRQSCQINGKFYDELVYGLLKQERK